MNHDLHAVLEGGTFFECPRWHDGRWYSSDIYRNMVVSLREDGSDAQTELEVDQMISGTGWLPDGTLLVTAAAARQVLRVESPGKVEVHASFGELFGGLAIDMVVDGQGRAFVGDLGFPLGAFDLESGETPPGAALVRVDPDGSAHLVAEDLLTPNGMVVDPAGTTLFVGETLGSRYTAFSIAPDGSLSDRRIWADLATGDRRPAPDGCTLDAENRIWFADAFGGRCTLVEEGGRVVDEIAMPDGVNVYACALGGEDGRTLLMCCAPGFHSEDRSGASDALLMTTRVEVPHAGFP